MADYPASKKTSDDYAAKAAEVAGKLKPGAWESAQTLALISIASSLARIADQVERR